MSQPQKIHLFNCDHIYELHVITNLLNASKPKLGFEFTTEEHYFTLSQIRELSEKIIPGLQMDFAVFVVHAYESRLSINEDDRGYTKVYRALLQATGGKVIIVIGGDDNYKNEDEEERSVISSWARRKMSSQFREEFLDGRKSFVFSWDEKHRPIHEEALLHYFDPNKKGQKFQHQPPTQTELTPSPDTPAEPIRKAVEENILPSSIGKSQPKDLSVLGWNAKPESLLAVSQLIKKHRDILNLATDPDVLNITAHDMVSYLENNPLKCCVLVVDAEKVKDARYLERRVDYLRLLQTAEINVAVKVIVMVCCPLSLSREDELVVNRTIKQAFTDSSKVSVAWFVNGKLVQKADDFIMLLTSTFASAKHHAQQRTDAAQIPFSETKQPMYAPENAATGSSLHVGYNPGFASGNHYGYQPHGMTENLPLNPPTDPYNYKIVLPPGKTIMVMTRLRCGIISNLPDDIEYWKPGFVVPDEIKRDLMAKHREKKCAELVILVNETDKLISQVDKEKEKELHRFLILALDETIMLQTRIINGGQVSSNPKDVVVRYSNWSVPGHVIQTLRQYFQYATLSANLFIISDSKGNLKAIVDQPGTARKMIVFGT